MPPGLIFVGQFFEVVPQRDRLYESVHLSFKYYNSSTTTSAKSFNILTF
ncbi:hypothetical protein F7734_25095 [Scytonema sp. UIC 10036]|nr:hypothetical protein [Scytonema sp. UIC 10036]MUG95461.1 hypothetical protein [Scytonema sp. UIC 10036]